ncbi:hypothetical protein BDD12DRAFT_743932, partial [Trichophaea hybrida]
ENRNGGAGSWLFEKQIFQKWEASMSSRLWMHGIPGSGKTILASSIIERQEKAIQQGYRCGFAYFYCQYNREEMKLPLNIIRTILAQLLCGLNCSVVDEKPATDLVEKNG